MSALEVLGRDATDEALWFSVDGDEASATTLELAALRRRFQLGAATVKHDGLRLDESQVTALIAADAAPQTLWPLEVCRYGDADAVVMIDGDLYCHGHAQAYSDAENALVDEAVGA